MRITMSIVPAIVLLAACVPSGTQPHDMSAAQHEAMGRKEDQSAGAHAAQFDPSAQTERARCGGSIKVQTDICWSSIVNPTASHLKEAEDHHRLAALHRAASQALRDAEARACVGLSDLDRDMSPFMHREEIASVEVSVVNAGAPKGVPQTRGAIVYFRAAPGLTAQWLQRIVDCHLARNAALGHNIPEMPYCPLVPKDVTARVTPSGSELAVEITSGDPAVAQEIVRRAQGLVSH